MIYQDASDDGLGYGYDECTKLANESHQKDDETACLDHSQRANLSRTQKTIKTNEVEIYLGFLTLVTDMTPMFSE